LRQSDLNFMPVPSMGDKLATIRLVWEPYLKRDCVFVERGLMPLVAAEFNVFPSQMLDFMDAAKLAIAGTHSVAEDETYDYDDDDVPKSTFDRRRVGSAGY